MITVKKGGGYRIGRYINERRIVVRFVKALWFVEICREIRQICPAGWYVALDGLDQSKKFTDESCQEIRILQ